MHAFLFIANLRSIKYPDQRENNFPSFINLEATKNYAEVIYKNFWQNLKIFFILFFSFLYQYFPWNY